MPEREEKTLTFFLNISFSPNSFLSFTSLAKDKCAYWRRVYLQMEEEKKCAKIIRNINGSTGCEVRCQKDYPSCEAEKLHIFNS